MSSAKKLSEFLPVRIEVKLVQARVPAELAEEVREQMSRDQKDGIKMDWNKLVEAACRAYLDERKRK